MKYNKNMLPKVLYITSRVLAILIGVVVFAFITEGFGSVTFTMKLAGALFTLLTAGGLIYFAMRQKNDRWLALLPVAYWVALLVIFLMGGFVNDMNFIRFLFVSLVASITTALAFYAWRSNQLGGSMYVALGVVYIFLAFKRVETLPLIIVLTILLATGVMFYLGPNRLKKQIPNPKQDKPNKQEGDAETQTLNQPDEKSQETIQVAPKQEPTNAPVKPKTPPIEKEPSPIMPPSPPKPKKEYNDLKAVDEALQGWQSLAQKSAPQKSRTFKNVKK